MKKTLVLVMGLLCGVMSLLAQQMPQPLPMDPNVRYGRLDNGLTYYIAHNELPEHRAEFYIAQRVGSVLEEENQRGLAHFLEHMAFNGLKNFPGKSMLEYLQKHGVKFGTNVNAYTSIDETVYNISGVPTDPTEHPNIVDSCLLILHDWSGYISLEDEEIDNERGVIHEEWRSRNSASQRMIERDLLPKLMPGSRYACRMPIGLMSVVDSFQYEELRDYYHKWYRPDLQAIFVVGDIDVDQVEQKVRTLWQDIQTPADAAERVYHQVPDHAETYVCVSTDPEFSANQASITFKHPQLPAALQLSAMGYVNRVAQSIIASIINQRLSEIAMKADAPFQAAGVGFGNLLLAKTADAFEVNVSVKPGKLNEGMMAAMAVAKSVQEYGVTFDEVERILADMTSGMENAYNERDKRKNGSIISEMKRHFLNNEPMPGIEMEWTMLFPQIKQVLTVDALNQMCKSLMSDQNSYIYFMGQQKEGNPIPTEEELLTLFRECMAQPVQPYAEEAIAKQLVEKLPKPGKVKKVSEGPLGSTMWTLSNGVKVIWKQTDFAKDAVSLVATSMGGYQVYKDEKRINRETTGIFYDLGGVGQFSPTALHKALAGKNVNVSTSVSETGESIHGGCTPKDMRTMFELVYLRVTAPRQDQEVYQSTLARIEQNLKNQIGTPSKVISDSSAVTFYKGQPDQRPLELDELKDLDYDRVFQLGKERFANAADFTFFLIGNIDEDSLRTMCCQYLATLPTNKKFETFVPGTMVTSGSRENRFDVAMEQPKTTVSNQFTLFNQPWNLKDHLTLDMLGQVLRIVFTETIREQEGGVYSPSARAGFNATEGCMTLSYNFETGADKCAHIEEVAYRETEKLSQPGGVSEEALQKVRDYMIKSYQDDQKENNYWISRIMNIYNYGINYHDNYLETLQSITTADLEAMMARMLKADRIQFVPNGVQK